MEKVYTVDEVADMLRVGPETIRTYLRNRKLKGFHVGREWRINETDLQAFVDQLRAAER